ncbi:sensor histidine kinase [Geofilum rubicundum]|nr:HAMP domain-containing sensor histidine kinase [Geofilum rubicundum]
MVNLDNEQAIGLLAGEVLKCVNQYKIEGAVCGRMTPCASCDLRQTFTDTFNTGTDYHKKEGSMDFIVDGETVHKQILISSSRLLINEQPFILLTIDDITKLKEQEKELSVLISTRDKLYSVIAHDLRGSISTIVGFTELILLRLADLSSERLKEFLENLQQAGQDSFNLLENLFEWTSVQWKNHYFNPELMAVNELVIKTIDICRPAANRKSIHLSHKGDFSGNWTLDKGMILTVLRNLVNNAIKFTDRGGQIVITSKKVDKDLIIEVTDTGIGIKAEKIPKMFIFEQGQHTHGTEHEKGTGLGLMICKEFVEKHKGIIWVSSIPGKGTTFSFNLPDIQ